MALQDVRYLVETIWGNCSALSEEAELKQLQVVRWLPSVELSPWNCLVLTREEATAHAKLSDPNNDYGAPLVTRIQQRHLRAKQHFTALQGHLQRAAKNG